MSNVRVFWIIWCCAWALGWACFGWILFGVGLLLAPISLLAILIPVGAPARDEYYRRQLPPYGHDRR